MVAGILPVSEYITALPFTIVPLVAPSNKLISFLSAVTPIRLLISLGEAVISTPPI